MSVPEPRAVADLGFEEALAELEGIVAELERGEGDLEASLRRFERGTALARRCEERLQEAEAKVALLLKEGETLVEVDPRSGETLAERADPGAGAGAGAGTGAGEGGGDGEDEADDEIPF